MPWPGRKRPGVGMQVVLKRIDGTTRKNLLRHSFHFQVPPLDEFGFDATHSFNDYSTITRGIFDRDAGRDLKTYQFSTLVVDHDAHYAVWTGDWARAHIGGPRPHTRDLPNGMQVDEFGLIDTRIHVGHGGGSRHGPGGGHGHVGGGRRPRERHQVPHLPNVTEELEALLNAGTPFRLIAWDKALWDKADADLAVTLRSLSMRERAGEPDARYYDLGFTQHREPQTRRRGYGRAKAKLPAVVRIHDDGRASEVISQGDPIEHNNRDVIGTKNHPATLRKLAKHFYNSHSAWKVIAKRNGIKNFGGDDGLDKLVKRGRKFRRLTIPKRSSDDHANDYKAGV